MTQQNDICSFIGLTFTLCFKQSFLQLFNQIPTFEFTYLSRTVVVTRQTIMHDSPMSTGKQPNEFLYRREDVVKYSPQT